MTYTDLPAINACLNGTSALLLLSGWIFIKRKNVTAHRTCMVLALCTSTAFLACYLYYHYQMQKHLGAAHTKFVNPPEVRPIYLAILFTHLLGAIAIVPLVIMTVSRAIKQRFDLHRKIARWTWPIWMYVSVTGVVIYWMLYIKYPQN